MSSVFLSAQNLSCERDDRLLFSDLSFDLAQGDVLQLEGPNGSGKTTLLRILSGLFTGFNGAIFCQGQEINQERSLYLEQLLFLGHKAAVKTALSPLENLQFLMGMRQQLSTEQLMEALNAVGLSGYEHVLCRNLSAGQQRRVALARLYLSDARLWLLDEMFTAIDKAGVAQFENLLAEKSRQGVTIILTTHHQLALDNVRKISLGGQRRD